MGSHPVLLLSHPTTRALAEGVAAHCEGVKPGQVRLRRRVTKSQHRPPTPTTNEIEHAIITDILTHHCCMQVLLKDDAQWDKFPDGFPNLLIANVKEIANRDGAPHLPWQNQDIKRWQLSCLRASTSQASSSSSSRSSTRCRGAPH